MEAPSEVDQVWTLGSRAAESEMITPIFMLRHEKAQLAALEETLYSVSTPGSPEYGKYLTREEVAARLPPVEGAQESVLTWLKEHGLEGAATPSGDMIKAAIPVGTAEKLFNVHFHHFKHNTRVGLSVIRATSAYSLPSRIASKVYIVGDVVELPSFRNAQTVDLPTDKPSAEWPQQCGSMCSSSVTPDVLKAAYNLGEFPASQKTTMAVSEFQGVSYDTTDNDHFQKVCALKQNISVAKTIGPNSGWKCHIPLIGAELCAEALLDVQYIKAVAGDIPLTDVSNSQYSLPSWAAQIDALDPPVLVHSVSYGNDEVQQTGPAYMDAANAQFMKLGTQGISVLFASGDQGVYGRTGYGMGGRFHPDFPAGSPYITAVGGTDFLVRSTIGAEKAWSQGGGGFSDHFAQPAYQKSAVASYMTTAKSTLPPSNVWNQTGRGYPDVAALGGQQNPYCVAVSTSGVVSSMMGIAGTSASCPVVSGVISRLNALRAASGKPPMGFLNPFIYKNPQAFNDVTSGKNNGMGPHGFTAVAGWDPATGFGTPNFEKLKTAAMEAVSEESTIVI
jgi:tripeptidyl-peptidase-1